jgi:hypothetical protein
VAEESPTDIPFEPADDSACVSAESASVTQAQADAPPATAQLRHAIQHTNRSAFIGREPELAALWAGWFC